LAGVCQKLAAVTRIYLTGRIAAEQDGRLCLDERDLHGRQGRLAFVYLMAHRHRPARRDELVDVLWSGAPPREFEVAFSAVLSRLRALFRNGLRSGAIAVEHGTITVRLPSEVWIDIEAALNATDLCEGARRRDDRTAAWSHANVAVAIARRPFLPDEEAPWITAWRTKLDAILVRGLSSLMTISALNNELTVAIQYAEEILAIEPYRETVYQELMRLHASMGNRAEALRVLTRCRERLRDELGIAPSPQTEKTWLAIAAAPTS
jgi:DNA-binding SARP family transcriptional activator